MSKARYGLVLIVVALTGLIGGAGASQLGQWGVLPRFLLPRSVQVQKGFEIVDNQGKRRVLLDTNGLTFFGDDGEGQVRLSAQRPDLTLYDVSTNSSVQLNPYGPYVIRFAQSAAHHSCVPLPEQPPGVSVPKLGIALKDGQVIWEVP